MATTSSKPSSLVLPSPHISGTACSLNAELFLAIKFPACNFMCKAATIGILHLPIYKNIKLKRHLDLQKIFLNDFIMPSQKLPHVLPASQSLLSIVSQAMVYPANSVSLKSAGRHLPSVIYTVSLL